MRAILLLTLSFAWSAAAQAQVGELNWVRGVGAEDCASGGEVRAEVIRRLGRDPFGPEPERILDGIVVAEAGGWVVRIIARRANGEALGVRTLSETDPDCHVLDSSIALAVALAIDPDAELLDTEPTPRTRDPEPPSTDSEPAIATDGPGSPTVEQPIPPSDPPDGAGGSSTSSSSLDTVDPEPLPQVQTGVLRASAFGGYMFGLLPGPAPHVAISVEGGWARTPWLRPRVGLIHVLESDPTTPDEAFAFSLTTTALGLCVATEGNRVAGSLCADVLLGALTAIVFSPRPLDPGARFWSGAQIDAVAGVRLGGAVWLEISANLLVPFQRERFRVLESTDVTFQQNAVVPGLRLRISVLFGSAIDN